MATEFSVKAPNRPGQLAAVASALGDAKVNIRGITGSTAGGQGTITVAVADKDAGKARRALKRAKIRVSKERKSVEVRLQDKPGTLARAAKRLAKAKVNIESAYVLGPGRGATTIGFGVKNVRAAEKALGRR